MLKEFKAGDKLRHIALVKVQKIGNTSNGGVFARGIVQDNSTTMNFICFETSQVEKLRVLEGFVPMVVYGQADINKFAQDNSLQLMLAKIEDVNSQDDITHLMPQAPVNLKEYKLQFKEYIENIKNSFLKQLMYSIFKELYDRYVINPAGSKLHHAYIGGLLEHCVDVTKLAVAMAKASKDINIDLVVCGALLHDLGKIEEISADFGFSYTTRGRLLGHIAITVMIVNKHAETLVTSQEDNKVLDELLHILLAHHGEQEKGSPVACSTKEGFIVHYADELNAVLNQYDQFEEGGEEWLFSKMINRYLYKKVAK